MDVAGVLAERMRRSSVSCAGCSPSRRRMSPNLSPT